MAKKKKKSPPKQRPLTLANKAFFNKRYTAVQKLFRVYGLDPDLLKSCERQVLYYLLHPVVESFRFKAAEGHHVPRRLLDFVSESTHRFIRTSCFGDESIGLTYFEMMTHGLAFTSALAFALCDPTLPARVTEMMTLFHEHVNSERLVQDLKGPSTHIRRLSMMISKVNFRIYGFNWEIASDYRENRVYVTSKVVMMADDARPVYFTHKKKERLAFPVRAGQIISLPASNGRIDRWFVTGEDDDPPVFLDIYIQSHALQRAKERMDIFPAHKRNYYIMEPLLYMHRVTETLSGEQMLECYLEVDGVYFPFGYFPFVVQGNRLFVLTFLPFFCEETNDGEYLNEALGLRREDIAYLGMDKLSFLLTIDFDQIPVLKEVISGTDIWNLREHVDKIPDLSISIDQGKTLMVKKFIERKLEFDEKNR
ncbi:MAG: hypothetical protein LBF09_05920 [Odoribacteraceae bacterium]|jgi:hypothetical protein|nr:hypothetical protein [Odoribacteraceae bacterium]